MIDPQAFLGQVPIAEGAGFGAAPPWGVASGVPGMPVGPMTREITSPYGWETNLHCYQCADGAHRDMTMAEAAAFSAQTGIVCTPTYNTACPGSPSTVATTGLYGRRRLGQNGGPAPSPGGGPATSPGGTPQQGVSPITVGAGDQFDQFDFFPGFFPGWPYPGYPPYPQMPARQQIVCRRDEERSEDEGRDVLVCEPAAPAAPQYQYPAYTPQYQYPAYAYPINRFTYPTYWMRPFWF